MVGMPPPAVVGWLGGCGRLLHAAAVLGKERAGGHAVRRIQRPQTACRSPPEPGESARTRRRQEPPFCRRFSSACTQPRGDVQQPPTAAEPPYNGARRHAHHSALNLPPQLALGVSLKAPPALGPWRMPRSAQRHHPRPRRRGSPRRRARRGLRDHGHGRRPSPTQTAPGGGRSRDHLVGGGRGASHVPYPDLAGWHRGQAAIGATGVSGAALNSLFYRSRVQQGAVTAAFAS